MTTQQWSELGYKLIVSASCPLEIGRKLSIDGSVLSVVRRSTKAEFVKNSSNRAESEQVRQPFYYELKIVRSATAVNSETSSTAEGSASIQ